MIKYALEVMESIIEGLMVLNGIDDRNDIHEKIYSMEKYYMPSTMDH